LTMLLSSDIKQENIKQQLNTSTRRKAQSTSRLSRGVSRLGRCLAAAAACVACCFLRRS